MVAGRALVIADALDLRLQHLGHVRQVDVVDARPRSVGRRRVVEGDGGGGLAERLHGPHLQLRLGQGREPLRRRFHDLGDEGPRVGQILLLALRRVRILEARIGLQEDKEVLQRADEADPRLDRLHLRLDARHLRQADLVDPVRRQVRGGRELQAGVVVGLALRQPPHAAVLVRHGLGLDLKFAQRRQHGLVSAAERTRQRRPPFVQQPGLGGGVGVQRLDLFSEVGPDRIGLTVIERRAGDHLAGVGDGRGEHEGRGDHALVGARLQNRGHLAHDAFGLADARHIGLGVLDAVHRMFVDQEHRQAGGRVAVGGEQIAPVAPALAQPPLHHAVLEQPPADLTLRRQGVVVEARLHLGQLPLGQRLPLGRSRVGVVVQLVVVGLEAQRGHAFGAQRQRLVERRLEPGGEAGVLALRGGQGRGGRRLRPRRRCGRQGPQHGGGDD